MQAFIDKILNMWNGLDWTYILQFIGFTVMFYLVFKVLKENKIYLESKGYETDNKLTKECYKEYLGE